MYKRIEKAATEEASSASVYAGMRPFSKLFVRAMTDEDVTRLLELKIRRISAYDIRKNRGEINDIVAAIKQATARLKNLTKTTIGWVQGILAKYGDQHPRRTEVETFHTVDKKAVAKANLRLSWDRDSGFFGSSVRANEFVMNVSDYDKILVVTDDGAYRVMSPPEKAFLPAPVLHAAVFDPEKGAHLNLVWLDAAKSPWGKRVKVERFITNKVYSLTKEGAAGHRVPLGRQKKSGNCPDRLRACQAREAEVAHRRPREGARVRVDGARYAPGDQACREGDARAREGEAR